MILERKQTFINGLINISKSNIFTYEQKREIKKVIDLIIKNHLKNNQYHNHYLSKNLYGYQSCHPLCYFDNKIDLVILYKREKNRLSLCNIGTHEEVYGFKKY